MAFRLPAVEKEKSSWWSAPPSLVGLRHGCFLPPLPPRTHVPRDIQAVRCDKTVALLWTLWLCAILSGIPLGILCGAVQDLHRCLIPLIERDNLLDVSMLEAVEEELATSPNAAEDAGLQHKEPGSWQEWVTALHTPN